MNNYNDGTIHGATFYVYAHLTPSGVPFYIGKGIGPRAWNFRNRSKQWLRKVAKHGKPTVQIILSDLVEAAAFSVERQIIAALRLAGQHLCNMTDGGEGATGAVRSAETRAKIAEANLGKVIAKDVRAKISASVHKAMTPELRLRFSEVSTGRKHTVETRERMSLAHTGKKKGPMSEVTRIKLSKACSGWGHTDDAKAKISSASKGRIFSAETCAMRSAYRRGTIWVTDGDVNKSINAGDAIPDGWVRGMTRRKK